MKEWREKLGLDDSNWEYFCSLYQRKRQGSAREPLVLHEEGKPDRGEAIAYPTAVAPPEILKALPRQDYAALAGSAAQYAKAARESILWVKKMQAGSGSSLTRASYLARQQGIAEREVRTGAKGTDLFVQVPHPQAAGRTVSISIAEAQILQALFDAERGAFHGILFHDILSSETEEAVARLWRKPSLLDPALTYDELVRSRGLGRTGRSFQAFLPTIDEDGQLSSRRTAPGGHGLFAVEALRAAIEPGLLPDTSGRPLISVLGNGEDLSSTPDPLMVGWMVKEAVPLAMVTTEKTANDMKGGQIAVVRSGKETYLTIVEQAQARQAGQLDLFEKLGLSVRRGQQIAYFNTNMALFNYGELVPRLRKLQSEIGNEALARGMAPDLIENPKSQKDADGISRKYIQLEGAMGSSLLNLDRLWRARYGEPLVHLLNVDRLHRTEFFSPIKTAFDFLLQFHSDRFRFDPKSMRLVNQRPGALPRVSLRGEGYEDVQTVLDRFTATSLLELDSLEIEGKFILRGAILRGNVSLRNTTEETVDFSGKVLDNTALIV